jgi:hypothetical protein
VFRRVQIATVVAYAIVLLLLVGTLIAYGAATVIDESRGTDEASPPRWVLSANPLFLAADLLADEDANDDITSPFRGMAGLLEPDSFSEDDVGFDGGPDFVVLPDGGFEGDLPPDVAIGRGVVDFDQFGNPIAAAEDDDEFPFWALSSIVLYTLAVLAGVVAVRRLRTPAEVER